MESFTNKLDCKTMFDAIATKYDRINAILSLGMHHLWNRSLIRMLGAERSLLDLCTGTGKVAKQYKITYPKSLITLVDSSSEMLNIAKQHLREDSYFFILGDVAQLPIENNSYPLAAMAYGLRNLPDPYKALQEVARVLTPSGRLGILELTLPVKRSPIYLAHKLYLHTVVPWIGKLFSKDPYAYKYLSTSIQQLPQDHNLEDLFLKSGFYLKKKKKLFLGVATIWLLQKK
ncbi:Demethylmenaquinone methyltransferase,ubiquinone/menaquinone biosynthesis methyltransferase,Trans-aconitate methyltransferase,ubiquinone/menaquinone biosynthesis methyltransferase,ubiE/COQ5 methyltransferase family [Chlamydia serpentis]|uniref:Demethylmenaquinone methyltransferase n=1 Tax=Chlamydia serpentis TaxID=1967782 RepID=A0A2R8FB33_9CHLA|nr:bifunctional demethylmenaquinone methyltransferase/2-methoxy-6-polyprenyl-1,4-benzoquinol methylase UbiE [Chlamydia serpentis]SPN73635.1 Demethylmenaquinone methyltransferase,ubiquinone/menaquinone biosynthesis methyltransferase,Trans-aconitate methyltransferase,ubiquinone/menaquinone biosynthesis methyltransferase,ubiE/COQ5 methyltransferase family [Chlamydia serpentis]